MTTFVQPNFWAVTRAGGPLRLTSTEVTAPALEPVSLTEVKARLRIDSTVDDPDLRGLIVAARRQVEKDLNGASLVATVWDSWMDQAPGGAVVSVPRWPLQSVTSVTSYDAADAATVFASTEYLVDAASRPGRVILNDDAAWPSGLRTHKAMVIRHISGFSGAAKIVSGITRSSTTATVTTSTAHGYATGNRITLAGIDQTDYNGTFEITVTGAATFTFTVAGSPTSPATGVMTATNLGIPETYTLAMLMLIAHWYAKREAVHDGAIATVPLGYEALLSDAPLVMV